MKKRHAVKWVGIFAALSIAGALLWAFFDWNWFRDPVAFLVSKALDRHFAIHGRLDVDLSMTPRITATRLELANALWGSQRDMLKLDRLEFTIRLKDLLERRVVLPKIRLSKLQLALEKDVRGKANWEFGAAEKKEPSKPGELPKIGLLIIEDGKLSYRDPQTETEADLSVSTGVDAANRGFIEVQGDARYQQERLRVEARGGSLLSLREKKEPYPLDIKVAFGRTRATAKGILADPVQFHGPDLTFTAEGPDLSEFYSVIGVPIPKTPPYKLSGHLTREGDRWVLRHFQGFVGSSDLSGDFIYTTRGERPYLKADLTSRKLDFKDLAGFLGAEPAPEKIKSNRLLPDKPYDLSALRAGDAEVEFRSNNIITPNLPIDEFLAHLQLDHGQLALSPLKFGIDIGQIVSNITLDARETKIATKADVEVRKVPFKRLLAGTRFAEQSGGTFLGRANLAMTGNSVAEMLGYGDGKVAIVMENGRISNLLVDLIGLDIAKSLAIVLTSDPSIPVRCIIANFGVTQGLMTAQPVVVDTTKSSIVGEGQINLRTETLDLRLTAHPKAPSILSARTPLIIKGRFKEPSGYPDPKYLAARVAASVALGVVLSPAGAIIPWVELGLGEDSQCQDLIAIAKQSPPAAPRGR